MLLQLRIELIEDNAWLDDRRACCGIDLEHSLEVATDIDDQRPAHRLTALTCPRATGQDGNLEIPGDAERSRNVLLIGRDEDPYRKNLIDRCVGRIASA